MSARSTGPSASVLTLTPRSVAAAGGALALGCLLVVSVAGSPLVLVVVCVLIAVVTVVIWPHLGLCGLPLVTAIGNRSLPGFPFGIQAVHLAMVLVVGATALHWILRREWPSRLDPRTRNSLVAMGAVLLALLVSTLVSRTPYLSLNVLITWTVAVAVGVCVAVTVRTTTEARQLLCMIVFASLLSVLPVLTQTSGVTAEMGGTVVSNRPTGAFVDPNELGAYCAVMLVLALTVLTFGEAWIVALGALASSFAALGLVLSFSRGAWFAAACAVLLFVAAPSCRARVLTWSGSLAVAGGLAAMTVGLNFPVGSVVARLTSVFGDASNPYDVRPQIWDLAVQTFFANPLFGTGPGSFTRVAADASGTLWSYPLRHAHNGVLTFAAETGAVGVASVIAVVVFVGLGLLSACFSPTRLTGRDWTMSWGLLVALISAGGTLLVDYTLRNPLVLMNLWLVVGLAVAVARFERRDSLPPVQPAFERREEP